MRTCDFPGCDRRHSARGLCHTHNVQRLQGRPLAPIRPRRRHGLFESPEYKAWENMKQRCLNPRGATFEHYGGRGITVSPVFRDSFEVFYAEVGPRPSPGHSIDRIDNERGYEPGNLRWATQAVQNQNRRKAA